MMQRVQELCRLLKPVLGKRVDQLYRAYLADDSDGKTDIEQTLELLASKHLGQNYQPDRTPFPPPPEEVAGAGQIGIGEVRYGQRLLYPYRLQRDRLKEHVLICGRSGSGKTNLTFHLMQGMMKQGVNVLALDWKRGYRDLLQVRDDLRVYTIGRDVSPFRFNPLIPPPGCEPHVWIKLIVDVIASAYLGGEGVISLLVGGLDHLYRQFGVIEGTPMQWPTVQDLLAWLRSAKLKGRAAMWQASAERILLAMTYGEFAQVVNTQDNSHVHELLDHQVVLEMDGLSAQSDRVMFSESLTLWLYRYRLAQGPRDQLTNVIVLEEAHNLLLARQVGSKESVLENSIRMIRQYGMGYVFVDQSASLLSKVAFANSYATIALSQKLAADVRVMTGAMNLTDDQKAALSTLPVGAAVIRLADQHPEPFLLKIPRCPIQEGAVSDAQIRGRMASYSTDSGANRAPIPGVTAVPPSPPGGKNRIKSVKLTHPPSNSGNEQGDQKTGASEAEDAEANQASIPSTNQRSSTSHPSHPPELSREAMRFLADVAARPLSTTVTRYQRLNLSRRRGNAIRHSLRSAGLIDAVAIATRSGQVILNELTDIGRSFCASHGIDHDASSPASLEHTFWARRACVEYEKRGYDVALEQSVHGNGTVDVLATRPGEQLAIEVETGKSNIKANLTKLRKKDFDRLVVIATNPTAVTACQKALNQLDDHNDPPIDLKTWLDLS